MSYIKADTSEEQEHFDYLEELRQSGDTNMFGAGKYLQAAFKMTKDQASKTLTRWMELHGDDARILDGPKSKTRTEVHIRTVTTVDRSKR
jgi:hypothetical protein